MCSSSSRVRAERASRFVLGVILLAWLAILAGCASTDSDLPWNNPQPWEGSPSIPGMSPQ
jgi:hypothetical protein